jgi:hypothetical protein
MSKEDQIKNLLTQIKEKAMFDDRDGKSGESFMVFHLKLLENLINEYFKENQ